MDRQQFSLERDAMMAQAQHSALLVGHRKTQPIHALVADDDPVSRGIVSEQLMRLNASSVKTVESGISALNMLKRCPEITLLVTDLKMPDMDGIALLRELEAFRARLSVIIMSALGDKILRAAATIGVGHNLHILGVSPKPVSFRRLGELVASATKLDASAIRTPSELGDIVGHDLLEALEHSQYCLHAQPEVNATSMKMVAVEMLSRWSHPVLSRQSPGDVILAAERMDLIDKVNVHMIAQAGHAWKLWGPHGISPRISLNLSAKSLWDHSFPDWAADQLAKFNLSPQDIMFELTETALPSAGATSLEVVCRLGLLGFGLAIDDYGTGYSNLLQLQDVPFSQLKIDKSFVDHIKTSREARTIVASSIRLAHDLGLVVVGEGVEDAIQHQILRELGCDILQGYHFAKPMSIDDLVPWAASNRRQPKSRLDYEASIAADFSAVKKVSNSR